MGVEARTLSLDEARAFFSNSFNFAQGNRGEGETQHLQYVAAHLLHPEWRLPQDRQAIAAMEEYAFQTFVDMASSGHHWDGRAYLDHEEGLIYHYEAPKRLEDALSVMNRGKDDMPWEDVLPQLALAYVKNDIYFLTYGRSRRSVTGKPQRDYSSFVLDYGYKKKPTGKTPVMKVYGEIYQRVFSYIMDQYDMTDETDTLHQSFDELLALYNQHTDGKVTVDFLQKSTGGKRRTVTG